MYLHICIKQYKYVDIYIYICKYNYLHIHIYAYLYIHAYNYAGMSILVHIIHAYICPGQAAANAFMASTKPKKPKKVKASKEGGGK